jgi:zinc D-Ala-D-Ala carboxypeptidase
VEGSGTHRDGAGGWPHFSAAEMACRHCGRLCMDPGFMRRLELLRGEFGRPMPVSSGYRCPAHDGAIGGAGVHPTGHAVDVRLHGESAYRLVALAIRRGFTGIGLNQRGPVAGRFVHLDDCPRGGDKPRPRIWTY